jgi:hypothetical protein
MRKKLFITSLYGLCIIILACNKTDDKKTDSIDKFTGTFSNGEYQLWDCGSGGTGMKAFSVQNATLSITKTGPETAEVTCSLPGLGQAFKCQASIQSDSTLVLPDCVHEGKMYDGVYWLRESGGKVINLFDPPVECRFLGNRVGNVVWTRSF